LFGQALQDMHPDSEETAQLIEEHDVEDNVAEDKGFSDITDDPTVADLEWRTFRLQPLRLLVPPPLHLVSVPCPTIQYIQSGLQRLHHSNHIYHGYSNASYSITSHLIEYDALL